MTSAEAIRIALEAGEPHETSEYRANVVEAGTSERGVTLLKLRMVRAIGLAERSHDAYVRVVTDDPATFRQLCSREWEHLVDQHRLSRQETGI